MAGYHPAAELAPRDIVARAIDSELKATGDRHVLLDLSEIEAGVVAKRFPNIRSACAEAGFDIPTDPIPVVPAAHYQCGGLLTDWDARTSLTGLYAVGEVSCTGVHGANRLASNSLLEAVVFSHRAALRLAAELETFQPLEPADVPRPSLTADGEVPGTIEDRVRDLMWDNVGIVRSDSRLEEAASSLDALSTTAARSDGTGEDAMRARQVGFMREVARLIVRAAWRRRESRGLHYTESYPYRDNERYLRDTILAR
jgi:L-aspartate oxidase